MSYGSLLVGCYFISLLKFVLVRWCLAVVSVFHVLQSVVIFGVDVVSLGAKNVSFGMLVASNLIPWGTIDRFRGTWEHKNGDLGVQAWMTESIPRSDWSCIWKALAC